MAASASTSRSDREFAIPDLPQSYEKPNSSRNKVESHENVKGASRRNVARTPRTRTSLEDTIEDLVELPLSPELLSSRAKADLAFHQRQSRALRHSSSQHSMHSLGDKYEPLGPATPGVEAYKRTSSSGSSGSGFLYDYYNSDPHEESFAPGSFIPRHDGSEAKVRRPSTSSQASDASRSKIPLPTNGLSRSWSSSEGLALRPSRTNPEFAAPRSPSQGSADADLLTMAPPRKSSIRRTKEPNTNIQTSAGKHFDSTHNPTRRGGHPSPSPQHAPAKRQGPRAPERPSASSNKRAQVESKHAQLGPKRTPANASKPTRAPQGRIRAVTGNAGFSRPAEETFNKEADARPRSLSTTGLDTSRLDTNDPPLIEQAPIMYRSDQISKSKTSDSLEALGRDNWRGNEEHAQLDQARTWDDVVIPTVAKQLHQQELLERAIAQDEAERAKKAEKSRRARDAEYQRAISQSPEQPRGPEASEKQLYNPPSPSPHPKVQDSSALQTQLGQPHKPAQMDLNHRKEVWEMPGLESPTTARKVLNGHSNLEGSQAAATKPPAEDAHQSGCCSGCTIS